MIDFSEFEFAPSLPAGVHKVIWKGINMGQSRSGSKTLELSFQGEDGTMYKETLTASEKAVAITGRKLIQLAGYTFGIQKARSIKAENFEELCKKLNPWLSSNQTLIKILITEEKYDGKVFTGLKHTDIASPAESMILDAIYDSIREKERKQEKSREESKGLENFEF